MGIVIQEVGPRDGLQNEAISLSVAQKVELVQRLAATGLRSIEVGSFVHPQAVPQMAATDEVLRQLTRQAGVTYGGLVLNRRGFERALAARVDELHFTFGVSASFNQRNQRVHPDDSLAAFAPLLPAAKERGLRSTLTLAVSFGCPFEGRVDPGQVLDYAVRGAAAGFDAVLLADTIGVAVPGQVRTLMGQMRAALDPAVVLGCHFHNTRNTGLANAYAALEAGATLFDAAIGGLGGCPFAPGATGNIATEDLVYMLAGEGIATDIGGVHGDIDTGGGNGIDGDIEIGRGGGIDLDALIAVARWLEKQLGHPLPGAVMKAGPFTSA